MAFILFLLLDFYLRRVNCFFDSNHLYTSLLSKHIGEIEGNTFININIHAINFVNVM